MEISITKIYPEPQPHEYNYHLIFDHTTQTLQPSKSLIILKDHFNFNSECVYKLEGVIFKPTSYQDLLHQILQLAERISKLTLFK